MKPPPNPATRAIVVLTREHDETERRKLAAKCHVSIIVGGVIIAVVLSAFGVSPIITGVFAFTPNALQELFDYIGKL